MQRAASRPPQTHTHTQGFQGEGCDALALAHPGESASSYLSSQPLANSGCNLRTQKTLSSLSPEEGRRVATTGRTIFFLLKLSGSLYIEPVGTRLRTSTRKKNQNRKASLLQPADVSQSLCGVVSITFTKVGLVPSRSLLNCQCGKARGQSMGSASLPARGTEILKSLKSTPTSTPPVSESGRSRNNSADLCHCARVMYTHSSSLADSSLRLYR